MKNGLEEYFIIKDNKKLRYGYTTGSCAAAAAGAAAAMLLSGQQVKRRDLLTPKGILLHLDILDIRMEENQVSCGVRKDGGDDPDATHGLIVYAAVKKTPGPGIRIEGGPGVGRVTKKGLEQPVGAPAINRVPRAMIQEEVQKSAETYCYEGGFSVTISIPGGEEVAGRTFNPRLGIEGGLSVLGTSGIVIPMSEDALIASIRTEMKLRQAEGGDYLLVTPGNYGEAFAKTYPWVDTRSCVKCSNYVGETVDFAVNLGLKGLLFVAHIGKFIKVSGGIMNTHSRCADSRAELMAAAAIRAGGNLDAARRILNTITTDDALAVLKEEGLLERAMEDVIRRISYYLQHRCQGALQTEVILFSNVYGLLGQTQGAEELLGLVPKIREKMERNV